MGGLIIFTNSNALLSYFIKDTTISNTVRCIILAKNYCFTHRSGDSKQEIVFFLQEKPSKQI